MLIIIIISNSYIVHIYLPTRHSRRLIYISFQKKRLLQWWIPRPNYRCNSAFSSHCQAHWGELLLIALSVTWILYVHITTHGTNGFTSHPKDVKLIQAVELIQEGLVNFQTLAMSTVYTKCHHLSFIWNWNGRLWNTRWQQTNQVCFHCLGWSAPRTMDLTW